MEVWALDMIQFLEWHLNIRRMLAGFSRTEKQRLTEYLKIYI